MCSPHPSRTWNNRSKSYTKCVSVNTDSDWCIDCGLLSSYCSCTYDGNNFTAQSGLEEPSGQTYSLASTSKTQTMTFSDQNEAMSVVIDSTIDETRKLRDTDDTDLDKFFSRPIKILDISWDVGTDLNQDLNPWADFFANPRVANRCNNYMLGRATLHVKVLVNGNGFYFGRAGCFYHPAADYDQLSHLQSYTPEQLVQYSQMPKVFIDPTLSTGGELTLPFFWQYDYVNVATGGFDVLGQLYFRSFNPLKHANGGTDPVNISVFVWATDVALAAPTTDNTGGLLPQSGEEIDIANSQGVVSGPATAVARFASLATSAPIIGPYAKATADVASSVAGAAKLFGYSRPPVTKCRDGVRQVTVGSMALTTVPEAIEKLTVDDKQELSIDPRIASLGGEDPLSILSIAKRESYLTTFDWPVGQASETMLWNCKVTPILYNIDATARYFLPAMCVAATPFEFWTG